MPSVNVTINGKNYRMACDEGQEQHLLDLGDELNGRIDELRGAFGEIGDLRFVVMAAIQLADDLTDAKGRMERVEQEMIALRARDAANAERQHGTEAELARTISTAAQRITDIARRLNAEE